MDTSDTSKCQRETPLYTSGLSPSDTFKVISDDDVSMEEKHVESASYETCEGSSTQEERRQKRRKQRPNSEVGCCPVCGVTLRAGDTSNHLAQELEKLVRLPQSRPLSQRTSLSSLSSPPPNDADIDRPSTSSQSDSGNTFPKQKEKPFRKGTDYVDYERIRAKRLSRTRQKHRRGLDRTDEDDDDGIERECPVCDQSFPASEIQRHTQRCLRQAETEFEDETVDVEGESDEEYEEYEWCGETRIRATTLLRAEGQLHAIGTKVTRGCEDEMVDVCDDEDWTFGPSQYSEEDLVNTNEKKTSSRSCDDTCNNITSTRPVDGPLHSEEFTSSDNDEIPHSSTSTSSSQPIKRKASELTSVESRELDGMSLNSFRNENNTGRSNATHEDANSDAVIRSSSSLEKSTKMRSGTTVNSDSKADDRLRKLSTSGGGAVIEALRSRVRELEDERQHGRYTCRICHEEYEKPVVSITCWHVHCETCWMQALAAKKLCPQCCVITTATDLRRIYL